MRKALMEVELGPAWAGGARNDVRENGAPAATEKPAEAAAGVRWNKPPSEGDKENRPVGEKEQQTRQGQDQNVTVDPPQQDAAGGVEKDSADKTVPKESDAKEDGEAERPTESAAQATT
jgi:hypothetical protein